MTKKPVEIERRTVVIPNTTPTAILEFFEVDEDATEIHWFRLPILAWRIESYRDDRLNHVVFVDPISTGDISDPWCYEHQGSLWEDPENCTWERFENVIEWARERLKEARDVRERRQLKATQKATPQ